jgi:hypothetical protein
MPILGRLFFLLLLFEKSKEIYHVHHLIPMAALIAGVVIRLLNVCEQIIFQEIMPPSLLFFSYQNNIIFIIFFFKKT